MPARASWLLVAAAAVALLGHHIGAAPLGPRVTGAAADLDRAVATARRLERTCAGTAATPLARALMATEAHGYDTADRIVDWLASDPGLAALINARARSLGPAQIKPASLVSLGLTSERDRPALTRHMIADPCIALALTDAVLQALGQSGGPCAGAAGDPALAEICAIRAFNGQVRLNRQNFAYLGFVQHVAAEAARSD